jgi:DNA-directed RNA polymerase specialized sigma24 family protein
MDGETLAAVAKEGTAAGRLTTREPTPTSNARTRELHELSLAVLSPREHELWHLVECDGWNTEDAAEKFGMSSSAVRGVIFRAKKKLIAALGDGSRSEGSM